MVTYSAWVLGRDAFALAGSVPFAVLAVLELAFLPGVAALLAPPLLRSRNRNTRLLLVLLALWAADAVFLAGLHRADPELAGGALRFALNLALLLITIIGGRIVPSFTANALRGRGIDVSMRSYAALECAVIGLMIVRCSSSMLCSRGRHWRAGSRSLPASRMPHVFPGGMARRRCANPWSGYSTRPTCGP